MTPTEIRARNSRAHAMLLALESAGAILWDALPPELAEEIQIMITTSRASRSNRGGRRAGAGRTSQNASA